MSSGTLILICGLPGAGKSTLAKRLEAGRRAILMSADAWIEAILKDPADLVERDRLRDPVENLQWLLTQDYLSKGLTVILENGFWAEEERSLYAVAALELGATIELYYCPSPSLSELWKRVEARNKQMDSKLFEMTFDELRAAWDLFEPPTQAELEFYDVGLVVPWS